MNLNAQHLSLGQLRKWKFGCVIEYRSPFLKKFGKAICLPDYYNKAWRAWYGNPTEEDRMLWRWGKRDQLCIMCSKSCGGCKWTDKLEPVDGWEANQTYDTDGQPYSWEITACPEFDPERRRLRDADDLVEDGCISLIQKALEIAKEDYIRTTRMSTRDDVVCFLSDWTPDYMEALRQLHADRNRYWGMRLLDEIKRQIKRQPVLLYAGGDD